jgi:hypothetical protein
MENGHHLQQKCPFGGRFFNLAGDAGDTSSLTERRKKE